LVRGATISFLEVPVPFRILSSDVIFTPPYFVLLLDPFRYIIYK